MESTEEKEIDPMENDDEKVSAMNNKLNPVAARLPRSARPNARTPDNHDLTTTANKTAKFRFILTPAK